MTKVKMLATLYADGEPVQAGSVADVPDELAALWLAQGYAEAVAAPKKTEPKPTKES